MKHAQSIAYIKQSSSKHRAIRAHVMHVYYECIRLMFAWLCKWGIKQRYLLMLCFISFVLPGQSGWRTDWCEVDGTEVRRQYKALVNGLCIWSYGWFCCGWCYVPSTVALFHWSWCRWCQLSLPGIRQLVKLLEVGCSGPLAYRDFLYPIASIPLLLIKYYVR